MDDNDTKTTTTEKDPLGWHTVAKEEFAKIKTPVKDADSVTALVNAIFATCKDEESQTQLQDLALMSGMACAVLLDYAELLREKEAATTQ